MKTTAFDGNSKLSESCIHSLERTGTPQQQVLSAMKLSPRTVQRRLLEHETSLRALADDVRRERAKTMLDRGTSVGEVAFSLGFAHVPASHKAFVRWTGKTPAAYVAERRRRSP